MKRFLKKLRLWLPGLFLLIAGGSDAPAQLRGVLGNHDPSTVIECKGRYYVFGTGQGIISRSTADKKYWVAGLSVFASPPAWTTSAVPGFTGFFWAPDIIFFNGRYNLYYSVSTWGSSVSAIGLVTNPTLDPSDPGYLWTDRGMVIQSTNLLTYNTIDPSVTRATDGTVWMTYGSYLNGIAVVQLDPVTGLRSATNTTITRIADNSSIEASCLFRRGGYYYLFADWGSCCAGITSTYNIRVGRSTLPTGPFLDRLNVNMVNSGGTLFLEGTGKFTGPGHMGILSDHGSYSFSYHYYDAGLYGYPITSSNIVYGLPMFDLEPFSWTADDWPVFTNDWSAGYRFEADARDEGSQYYGLLKGGASIRNDAVRGHVLSLATTNDYVQLPVGLSFARTYSAVLNWNGGGTWQRVFDFGLNSTRYCFLTPSASSGRPKFAITTGGPGGEQQLNAPNPMTPGVWTHLAVTLSGTRGVLYINGVPVTTNNSMSLAPMTLLATNNYLGKSQFAGDPAFAGQISSFRAFGRALSAEEIVAPQPRIDLPAGDATFWPGQTISFSGSAVDFMDVPLGSGALSWQVEYCRDDQTNVVFGPIAGVTSGTFIVPATGPESYSGRYRVVLTVTDGPRQNTAAIELNPARTPPDANSFYPFTADANDANGHYDGVMAAGASIQNDVERGTVLELSGGGYVSLPAGAARAQTVAAWVNWNGGADGQRVFDFGSGTNHYAFLTPSAAGKLRFAITLNGPAGEQSIEGPDPLPVGSWTHVAVVLDGRQGVLYTNGVPVATNDTLNLVFSDLGGTNIFLGRSQFPGDPAFDGRLSAVRLYALSLASNEVAAPHAVITEPLPSTLYNPGDLISFSGNATDLNESALAPSSLTWTVQFINGASTSTVLGPLTGVAGGTYTIPSSGNGASNGFHRVLLSATDGFGRTATNRVDLFPTALLSSNSHWNAFYAFENNAADAGGQFNGTLQNGASTPADAIRGRVLNLSGASQYVSLPAGVGNLRTFAGWVKWSGGGSWQRIFDFGQNTTSYAFLSPSAGSGRLRFAITPAGPGEERIVEAPAALPVNTWTHVAVTLDGRQGILFLNGRAIAVNNGVNLLPSDVLGNANYFGRSHFPDPYFAGQMDSFQLSADSLPIEQLVASPLGISADASSITLNWPALDGGLVLQSSLSLGTGTPWTTVTNAPLTTNGVRFLAMPADGPEQWFRLQWP